MKARTSHVLCAVFGLLVTVGVSAQTVVNQGSITIGQAIENRLEALQEHRYELRVTAPQSVTIEMNRIDDSYIDPYLSLQDASGREIAYNDDYGASLDSRIDQHLAPGTYYIIAREFGRDDAGRYRLSVSTGSSASPGAAAGQVREIPLGIDQSLDGYIRDGERQYYRLTVPRTQWVQIDMIRHESADIDPYLSLADANGTVIRTDDDGGGYPNSRMVLELTAGTYQLTARDYGDWSSGGFTISVTSTQSINTDAIPLRVGDSHDGVLQPGQEQIFLLTVTRDEFVVIDFRRTGGSSIDPYLVLADERGMEIDRDDDGGMGLDSRIRRQLAPGTYRITAYDLGRSRSGPYQLSVGTTASLSARAIPITVGQSYDGYLQAGEEAVYSLTLANTQDVVIDFMRAGNSDIDPYLTLTDSTGMEIARDDDGGSGLDSRIRQRLGAGTYIITGNDLGMSRAGQFRISVTAGDSPVARAIPINLGQSFDGYMHPGEDQVFTFTLNGTQRVVIDFMRTGNAGFDPYLVLSDRSMNEIERNDDGGDGLNSRIEVVLNAGVYYLTGRDFWQDDGGPYRMSLQPR